MILTNARPPSVMALWILNMAILIALGVLVVQLSSQSDTIARLSERVSQLDQRLSKQSVARSATNGTLEPLKPLASESIESALLSQKNALNDAVPSTSSGNREEISKLVAEVLEDRERKANAERTSRWLEFRVKSVCDDLALTPQSKNFVQEEFKRFLENYDNLKSQFPEGGRVASSEYTTRLEELKVGFRASVWRFLGSEHKSTFDNYLKKYAR